MATISEQALLYQWQHITEDKSVPLKVFTVLCLVLAGSCVALRVVSRKFSGVPFKADDWTIIASMFLMCGLWVTNFIGVFSYGLGKHAVAVGIEKVMAFLKMLYVYTIFYNFTILMIKNSILLLYHRIFITARFQLIVKLCIAFMLAYQVATLLVDIMTCLPIAGYWDKTIVARCVNAVTYFITSAGINVFTDVVILILPLPMVWNLQISVKQKLVLCGIFLLGAVVCVATTFRIVAYLKIDYEDPTWSFVESAYWTNAEVTLSIVCACLPTMRPLVRRVTTGNFRAPGSGSSRGYTPYSDPYASNSKNSKRSNTLGMSSSDESTRNLYADHPFDNAGKLGPRSGAWHDEESGLADPAKVINVQTDFELKECGR
ncbi:MAG: hypothetical protein M4579_005925 [Chaenotheca gracillima]|nr:MAG: hypothetical protein M4579_005925 [Chaenotheca gracillima]